jgi:CRISPR-associated protein Csb2
MPQHFCISVRFLDGAFHGRGDGGEPEWPPSPMRLFQALVAAAAARERAQGRIPHHAYVALRWLENLPAPAIFAPAIAAGAAYRLYVPDNAGDLVAKSWSRGNEASMAGYRTEKMVAPSRLCTGEGLHYAWQLTDDSVALHIDILLVTARSITHLGWGVDMVVADAALLSDAELARLPGQCWTPSQDENGTRLRIPCVGTLEDLERRHRQFLTRVQGDRFFPVSPLAVYQLGSYRLASEPVPAPFAFFTLRRADDSGFRSFDPTRRGLVLSAMLRHAASNSDIARGMGWSDEQVRRLVLGHGEERGHSHAPVNDSRLVFLPLPSVEPRGSKGFPTIGSIRRVLVTVRGHVEQEEFQRFAQRLAGRELVSEHADEPRTILARSPDIDYVTRQYIQTATTWATVTPVILPGYDDPRKLRGRLQETAKVTLNVEEKQELLAKLDRRIDLLIRKSIRQAGFSDELASNADLDWRATGFWPGTNLASRYAVPQQHRRYRRLHVRISWRDSAGKPVQVRGPICLGGGKFVGLGLFAAFAEGS